VNHLHGRYTFRETIRFNLSVDLLCTTCTLYWCIQRKCAHWQGMVRKCSRVVTFAHMHVTGTENQITCTPAIQWVMKVYVNGLLIYNVPRACDSSSFVTDIWRVKLGLIIIIIIITVSENQITCTPAIQWVMKVYVNKLLIYNVPHMLSVSVYNWRFSVDRKWLRTAAQLLGFRTSQHSTEMWITCMVAIRLVRKLYLISVGL